MEELKIVPPADDRKPYEPPQAEVIVLEPREPLALIDTKFHDPEDHWVLNGWTWGDGTTFDPASGTYGVYTPEKWELPPEP